MTIVKQQAFHSTQAQGISVQPLSLSDYTQLGLLDIYDAQIDFEAPFMTVGARATVSHPKEASRCSHMGHGVQTQETRVVTDPSNTQSSLVQVKDALGRYCSH